MKRLFLFVAACIISVNAFSQSFQHGLGISVFFDNMVPDKISAIAAVTYSPRYNFHETENISVSLGIPLSIGFMDAGDGDYDAITGEEEISDINGFTLDVPVMVNFNFGAGASRMNKGHYGGFIGAGYAYHYASSRDYTKDGIDKSISGRSFGLTVNGGIRINIGDPVENVELRVSYFRGRNPIRQGIVGVGAIFNF